MRTIETVQCEIKALRARINAPQRELHNLKLQHVPFKIGDRVRGTDTSKYPGREFVVCKMAPWLQPDTASLHGFPILDNGDISKRPLWIGLSSSVDAL